MNLISTLALAMGSSWVSGIRLYATVATLGLLGRFAHLPLPGELEVLTNGWIIGVASALFVIEFFADKIPYLDSTWDVIHTFIRIPAGAVLAAAAFGDFDRKVQIVALLVGGGLALSAHGTKATARAAVNLSPEPFSNIVVSLVEDVVAIASMVMAFFLPIALIILVTGFVVISLFLMPKIAQLLRKGLGRPWRAAG
ncbi:MAG: rane protein [Acidobacteria bacterium]|nr:rane protein [Acidobacteriota bacterium]